MPINHANQGEVPQHREPLRQSGKGQTPPPPSSRSLWICLTPQQVISRLKITNCKMALVLIGLLQLHYNVHHVEVIYWRRVKHIQDLKSS